jgi:hypothetical protein
MNLDELDGSIAKIEQEIAETDQRKTELLARIAELRLERTKLLQARGPSLPTVDSTGVTSQSLQEVKIALFRSLFRGREDVFARRFESKKTGKKGYQPACRNEWLAGICEKPRIRCDVCAHRELLALTENVLRNHLLGMDPQTVSSRDFTIGVYPMLPDETCWFLAADFDKSTWREDVRAFLETCTVLNVPATVERSRSGNGGHIWIFFSDPVPAAQARKMGALLLSRTMEQRPEIGLDSYDRFFPSQDTLPNGGFGSLIALPLQKKPRECGNSLFLDHALIPYQDQWSFLSSLRSFMTSN